MRCNAFATVGAERELLSRCRDPDDRLPLKVLVNAQNCGSWSANLLDLVPILFDEGEYLLRSLPVRDPDILDLNGMVKEPAAFALLSFEPVNGAALVRKHLLQVSNR